jgi:hypothetical protein
MRRKAYTGFWWGNLREGDHLGDSGLSGMIILRWIFRKWVVGLWTGSSWLRIGRDECGNEPSGSMKCGEFLDLLKTGWFLKKDSTPWSNTCTYHLPRLNF